MADLSMHIEQFTNGKSTDAYKFLGCHFVEIEKEKVALFRVWAPNAKKVSVCGDFNDWNTKIDKMQNIGNGIWECYVKNAKPFDKYKFFINYGFFKNKYKSDPYQFFGEDGQGNASVCYEIDDYKWGDSKYLSQHSEVNLYESPMNIYEVQLGSWKKNADDTYYSYRQFADEGIKYVKEMGYTHIELMPILEHPFDGSWGYQVCGYYSPTFRYGKPEDFKYLIDICHQNNIGVILDWVPAHFCKDAHGLMEFDGSCCYESPNPLRNEHKGWGTRIFDYGRYEVKSFLISNALFWLREYHIDGLRVDAVASMLYLDYDKKDGEWEPNIHGGNYNLEAIDFLQKLNVAVFAEYPNALMIAEESTSYPGVTLPTHLGGLGFNFKWNMGWMNDMLCYISSVDKRLNANKLTFPFVYYAGENYILPISHDEVVHGKKSLLDKMTGSYEEKFASLRTFLAFMMASPGKKLLFMGCEFGQFIEWNYKIGLDFLLLDYPKHRQMQDYVKALNNFYKTNTCLFQCEKGEGFEWIKDDSGFNCVVSFKRKDKNGDELIFVCNFSSNEATDYRIPVRSGKYEQVFNTDCLEFGGDNNKTQKVFESESNPDGTSYIMLNIPKLSAKFFKIVND